MKVTIEFITDHFLELEYNLPFIGHFKFPIHGSYGVVNDETGAVIKKGFHTSRGRALGIRRDIFYRVVGFILWLCLGIVFISKIQEAFVK